jgi:Tol biopolymer transport system component
MRPPATFGQQENYAEGALFIMNADGTNRRPLLKMKDYLWHSDPCFSSDGKKLAFRAFRNKQGEKPLTHDVVTANADGSEAKNLGKGQMPSFSPDGEQIVFTLPNPNVGVWTMNAAGGNRVLIDAQGYGGQWSPDGKSIAYSRFNPLIAANICVYDVKTKARRFLFEHDEDTEPYREIHYLTWSPDSKRVCFMARRMDFSLEVAVMSAKGEAAGFDVCFPVKEFSIKDIAWHPDGKKILVSKKDKQENDWRLFTFEPGGDTSLKPIPPQPEGWSNITCCWTPDGKRIVFSSQKLERK